MFCPECGNHAANKALRKLGIETEKTMVEVLPVTEFEETGAKEYKGFYQTSDVGNAALEIGKSYTVILDGQEYSGFLCKPVGTSNQRNYIGNSIVSGEENNVPFIVISVIATGVLIVCTKTVGAHTLAIYEETETIHPIDQKYLPGVCLPVLEVSEETTNAIAAATGDSTVFVTASEEAFFREMVARNSPCVVKLALPGFGAAAIVCSLGYLGLTQPAFIADLGLMRWAFHVTEDDIYWTTLK